LKSTGKAHVALLTPLALLVAAYIFYLNVESMPALVQEAVWWSPFVVFLPAMIISCRFNNSRVFFVLLVLLLVLLSMYYYFLRENAAAPVFYSGFISPVLALLIPLNILIFSLLKERGFLTLWGAFRFTFIFLQVVMIFWLAALQESGKLAFASGHLAAFDFPLLALPAEPSAAVFILAGAVLAVKQVLQRSYHDAAFIGVLAAMFVVIQTKEFDSLTPIFFAACGIMLLISVLQHSYAMAFYDELTGLASRRRLEQDLMKLGTKYAIAMLDIDYFKKFNDTYGHDVGDDVLRFLASMIRGVTGGGRPYRYGGEEFTIIFPGKGRKEAALHLEKLRERIAARGFALRGKDRPKKKPKKIKSTGSPKRVSITISIGVAEKNDKYKTPASVIKAADAALYRAKKKGRNCLSF